MIAASPALGAAVADVVAQTAVQERGVLRDHRDAGAQALLGDARDVLAVDQDAARLGPVEAEQQVHQCRLAGAGMADQADAFAGPDASVRSWSTPRSVP